MDAYVLFSVSCLGAVGNLGALTASIFCKKFNLSSATFLCHHCVLDLMKSLFCIPYGYSLLTDTATPYCNIIGVSYVFLTTTSAYNLLALLINEKYELLTNGRRFHRNQCCILFGIVMTWFTSLLLNLGIALIPFSPEYNHGIGNCIFVYGVPSDYILHVLWIVVISGPLFLSIVFFISMYRKARVKVKRAKWSSIHNSILREMNGISDSSGDELSVHRSSHPALNRSKRILYLHSRRVIILLAMVSTFVLFWYPLFLLTLIDHNFDESRFLYKVLNILAWSHPVTTPIFSVLILYDLANKGYIFKRVYSKAFPLRRLQRKRKPQNYDRSWKNVDTAESGICNTHFDEITRMSEEESSDILIPSITTPQNQYPDSTGSIHIEQLDRSPSIYGKNINSGESD